MDPTAMDPVVVLPAELVLQVLQFVDVDSPRRDMRTLHGDWAQNFPSPDMVTVSRLSRRWNALVAPLIFRHTCVKLRAGPLISSGGTLKGLRSCPPVSVRVPFIESLTLDYRSDDTDPTNLLNLIKDCPKLSSVLLLGDDEPAFMARLIHGLPSTWKERPCLSVATSSTQVIQILADAARLQTHPWSSLELRLAADDSCRAAQDSLAAALATLFVEAGPSLRALSIQGGYEMRPSLPETADGLDMLESITLNAFIDRLGGFLDDLLGRAKFLKVLRCSGYPDDDILRTLRRRLADRTRTLRMERLQFSEVDGVFTLSPPGEGLDYLLDRSSFQTTYPSDVAITFSSA